MRKQVAGAAVSGLALFGGVAVAQQEAQQPEQPQQRQEQPRQDGQKEGCDRLQDARPASGDPEV